MARTTRGSRQVIGPDEFIAAGGVPHINAAMSRLRDMRYSIDQILEHLSNAYQAAVGKHQLTGQIRFLQRQLDASHQIIEGQVHDLLQKLVEVEASSQG